MKRIIVGTRKSKLALIQVKEILDTLSAGEEGKSLFTIIPLETAGDKDKHSALEKLEGTDFFTDGLDWALLQGRIDLAVHSAKDLPDPLPEGLRVVWRTRAIDPADVLVSRTGQRLLELPAGSLVGTSSRRRREQVLALRPELTIKSLRGNVDERLAKLDRGEYDGIIVAAAALIRLGEQERITERLKFSTPPGQGSLAVVVCEDDEELSSWLQEKFILSERARAERI